MRDNALYFPYISIPNSTWVMKTLLYWNRISSIVPIEYVDKPELHSEFMLNLLREGLVEQIFPQQHLYQVRGFEEEFINYISRKITHNRNSHKNKRFLVHIEKLGNLPSWLIERDLAEKVDYSWYAIEDWVAAPYMAYLANILGSIDEVNAAPVTDSQYLSNYYQVYEKGGRNSDLSESRDYILTQLLPYPDETISLDSLLRFKQDYGYLLPRLREKIEIYSSELSLIQDQEQRIARADTIISACKDDVAEIHEYMSISWNKVLLGSIVPLIGAGGAVYATSPSENAVAAAAAGFSFLAATYQAISSIPRDQRIGHKPLAYLAFAEKEL